MALKKLSSLENASEGTKKILKPILAVVGVILVAALGLQMTDNDWDLGKILSGESWSDSKVVTDTDGNIMRDKEGNVVTEGGKATGDYNCDDFATQADAQKFFDKVGGVKNDANGLDRDKDGIPCESLPAN